MPNPNPKSEFSFKNNICSFKNNGYQGATYKAKDIDLKINKKHSLKILYSKRRYTDVDMRIGPIMENGIFIKRRPESIGGNSDPTDYHIDATMTKAKYLLKIRNKKKSTSY